MRVYSGLTKISKTSAFKWPLAKNGPSLYGNQHFRKIQSKGNKFLTSFSSSQRLSKWRLAKPRRYARLKLMHWTTCKQNKKSSSGQKFGQTTIILFRWSIWQHRLTYVRQLSTGHRNTFHELCRACRKAWRLPVNSVQRLWCHLSKLSSVWPEILQQV